jgi:hypothetical protein
MLDGCGRPLPWHFLRFRRLPHQQGSFRPIRLLKRGALGSRPNSGFKGDSIPRRGEDELLPQLGQNQLDKMIPLHVHITDRGGDEDSDCSPGDGHGCVL